MTEDLIAMAAKAGFPDCQPENHPFFPSDLREAHEEFLAMLERFAALIEARAVARTREECAVEASSWKRSKLLLHAGEMTTQERRTCEAVADGIAASIRALGERT